MKIILILILTTYIFAQEVDENALFADSSSVITSSEIVNTKLEAENKTLSISGEINSNASYNINKDWLLNKKNSSFNNNSFSTYISGNLLVDIRLKNNVKGFVNWQIDYYSTPINQTSKVNILNNDLEFQTESNSDYSLKEFFFDFNWRQKAFFRTGKQVLQWGRCYLWNPADLINVDKKDFIAESTYREGTYGLKSTVPVGTVFNYYNFIGSNDNKNIDGFSFANKFELLINTSEIAVSAFVKKSFKPVYAFDFSTAFLKLDFKGEAAFSYGDNSEKITLRNDSLTTFYDQDKWISRAALSIGRSFDWQEEKSKIMVQCEFFYNGGGYAENIFAQNDLYAYEFKNRTDSLLMSQTKPNMTKKEFIFYRGLYQPNQYNRYYCAFFTTINKFLYSDLTFTGNVLVNLEDQSGIGITGISYSDINDFSLGMQIIGYGGSENGEMTFHRNALTIKTTAGIRF